MLTDVDRLGYKRWVLVIFAFSFVDLDSIVFLFFVFGHSSMWSIQVWTKMTIPSTYLSSRKCHLAVTLTLLFSFAWFSFCHYLCYCLDWECFFHVEIQISFPRKKISLLKCRTTQPEPAVSNLFPFLDDCTKNNSKTYLHLIDSISA